MADWRVPLFDTDFGAEEEQAVLGPLRAGWLTMGEEVEALERVLAEATGAAHVIATTNCTAAMQLACAAVGVGPGDEVICPSLTFVATANAPRVLGAAIKFCESLGEDDLTMDPASVERLITDRTKAIMAMHYGGFPCQMAELLRIAESRDIAVIEDSAHALFTFVDDRALGRFGVAGCFSFFSNKNATCGEGGAVITDDPDLAKTIRLLRSHGMTTLTMDRHKGRAFSYDVVCTGYNFRMDEIRAALMRVQLKRLPGFLQARRTLFKRYAKRLAGTPITVPFAGGRFKTNLDRTAVHIQPVLLPEGTDRPAVMEAMKQAGIQTSVHYPPVHLFTAYRQQSAPLRRTEALAARELTLPLFPTMPEQHVDLVVESLLAALH